MTSGQEQADSSDPIDPVELVAENWRRHGYDAGPQLLAALSIIRVEEIVRRTALDVLEPLQLTYARFDCLALLYFAKSGSLPMTAISRHLVIHPTSATGTVDYLVKAGWASRVEDPLDRRVKLIELTDRGRSLVEQGLAGQIGPQFGLEALSDRECVQLFRLLRKVRVSRGDLARGDI